MKRIINIIVRLLKWNKEERCENCIFSSINYDYCYMRHRRTSKYALCRKFQKKGGIR